CHGLDSGPDAGGCGAGAGAAARLTVTVTRLLVGVATRRLAMSAGRSPALAGMVTGPALQASQTPVTSVPPAREATIRLHGTLSGRPCATSWMLVPQDVPVSV